MKNSFIKEKSSGIWIAAAVTGVLAAGATAWYYIKRATIKPEHNNHTADYLKPKSLLEKKTTDLHNMHPIATS